MADGTIIRIMCPTLACQRVLAVPEQARGKLVRCRGCGATIRIPEPKAAEPAAGPDTKLTFRAPAAAPGTAAAPAAVATK